MTAEGGKTLLLPQFTRIIEDTKPFIVSTNLCDKKGAELLVGEKDSEYKGC